MNYDPYTEKLYDWKDIAKITQYPIKPLKNYLRFIFNDFPKSNVKNYRYTFKEFFKILAHLYQNVMFDFVVYGETISYPISLYPLGKDRSIVIDPAICAGQPTVKGTRLTTAMMYRDIFANHPTKEYLQREFGLNENQIKDIIAYERGERIWKR